MTLYETIQNINKIAAKQPNINNIIESGDIFDLNKEEYEQKYSAFCCTQRTHVLDDNFITFNFTLYYVDRLNSDRSNTIFIQSTACEVLTNIIRGLNNLDVLSINYSDITTFTERFTAECAGAFINISLLTPYTTYCEDEIE